MGKQRRIAELMSQTNEVLTDMPWMESSEMSGHEFVYRTSVPAGAWRQINAGIPFSKSTTAKARVGLGELVGYSQVDRTLAERSGDLEQFRYNEDVAFLEGMSQTLATTIFYGNTISTPAQFMGLAPFYNTVSTATAMNAANVIDGLGTASSNLSIWLICWGERTIKGLYPRNSKAGLVMEDKGDTVPGYDSLGNRFEAYTSFFRQEAGLVPEDWRYGVRYSNIDVTSAGLAGPNAQDLFAVFAEAVLFPPTLSKMASGITETDAPDEPSPGIRPVWYMNRTARHWADVQGMRDRNVLLSLTDAAGRVTDYIRGIPVRIVDALLNTEARVV
jgi:hypothetical protein